MFARSIVRAALFATCAAALPLTATAAAPNPAAATVQIAVGTWNCVMTGPMGTATSQIVWTPFGDGWVHGKVTAAAAGPRPAHTADISFGYDPEAKLWVEIYADSLGEYGIVKSSDAPTAKTITYTEAYPVFPNDGPQVVALGPAVTTIDD
ncbi:MAG: DUF1579 family protein, partial [Candidatus Eremiobacteraeota bacterium]|nr:DUF1579 family protein [Candidatus Eremiobacteraeota bacterium]